MTWWHRLVNTGRRIATGIHHVAARLGNTARSWVTAATQTLREAGTRHSKRVHDDQAYSRTVSAAISELITTLIPRPWLATAIAVALAGLLTAADDDAYEHHSSAGRYDPEPSYRDPYPVVSRRPAPDGAGSLWDRLQ